MRRFLLVFLSLVVSAGAVFLLTKENEFELVAPPDDTVQETTHEYERICESRRARKHR